MKKMTFNRFWLGMACAGGILALIWSAVVLPLIARHSRLQGELGIRAKDLELAKRDTPSRVDRDGWVRYRSELTQSRSRIAQFYGDNSKAFQRGFPDLPAAPDGDPARDSFVARYQDEAKNLEQALLRSAQHVLVGGDGEDKTPGFNWEDLRREHWDSLGRENERVVLRELQKRFRTRQRIADLALRGRVDLKRIVDFRFFNRLHERFPEGSSPRGGIPLAQWPGWMSEVPGGTPKQFQETPLPGDLGRQFTFGFAIELPYSEVTKAIHEVLSPGGEASSRDMMLINVIGTHVAIVQQNQPQVSFNYEEGNEQERRAKEKEILRNTRPHNVLLTVTCQIMDFDPTKLRELSAR